ncbi:MAG: electron transport complex subunit RsxA [Clostridiales bacterium]|nr:electron transport complex subunit RsxA [Clostridiales bacterium]
MTGFTKIVLIVISAALVNNYVLSRYLGICPFLGVSKKVETAVGMSAAVTFVMVMASVITFLVQDLILQPTWLAKLGVENIPDLRFLQTIAFILVIASLVQFVEMMIQKTNPSLYSALGVYLPLITTNCAVLGVAVINIREGYNLVETVANSFGAAIGFGLAIILFAGIRERLEYSDIPKPFIGFPIALIAAGLMSVAFLGFNGLIG